MNPEESLAEEILHLILANPTFSVEQVMQLVKTDFPHEENVQLEDLTRLLYSSKKKEAIPELVK